MTIQSTKRNLITKVQVDTVCATVNITSIFPQTVDDISAYLANQTSSLINSAPFLADLAKNSKNGTVLALLK